MDRGLPAFFNELNELGINWCSWKNNHLLEQALIGEGDVDLLVDGRCWRSAMSVLYSAGFVEVENRFLRYPYVHHFFGPGDDGRIVHLHVYRRVLTGESQTKAYDLPLTDSIFFDLSKLNGIMVPSQLVQKKLFLLRYFIKIGSIYSIARTYADRLDYADEYRQFEGVELDDDRWLGIDFEALEHGYVSRNWLNNLFLSYKLKRRLSSLNRFGFIELFLFRQYQIFYRLVNKLFFHQKKKLVSGGLMLAVVGLDGAGKTTSVAYLENWLRKSFDVRVYHLGRPRSSILGSPFNLALWLIKKVLSVRPDATEKGSSQASDRATQPARMGFLGSLRYLVLAHDRAVLARSANRYRARGGLVVLDRLPSTEFGKMDSPRIPMDSSSNLVRMMARIERGIYDTLPWPDVLIRLDVPVDVAVARNNARVKAGKETEHEIRARHKFNGVLNYRADKFHVVDMDRGISAIRRDLRNIFWSEIS